MRSSGMPGARSLRIEVSVSTAKLTAEISTKVTPSSHTSEWMPGECALDDSGVYMNQPLSGAAANSIEPTMMVPPRM